MRPFQFPCLPLHSTNVSLHGAKRTIRTSCYPQCASNSVGTWKNRPANDERNDEVDMSETHSDALVFFGATGDLAYKKIFPALQAMVKRGNLNVPVIGVAKAGWNLDQLRERARDGIATFGGGVDEAAFAKLVQLLK